MYQSSIKLPSHFVARKFCLAACIFYLTLGVSLRALGANAASSEPGQPVEASHVSSIYDWNLKQAQLPLLSLPGKINSASDLSLAYPMGKSKFPLFQSLQFNERANQYTVLLISDMTERVRTIELKEAGTPGRYASTESRELYLIDNQGVKAIRTGDGTEYTFVRFTDGASRCVRVRAADGSILTLVYGKDNLIRGLVDARGRALRFNYENARVSSITQTWTNNSTAVSKTWPVGEEHSQVKFAHATVARSPLTKALKPMPNNAVTPEYTALMAGNDQSLAAIFGDSGAVAAANGFEPAALAHQYPLYRGDLIADDGHLIRGHLSYAMHLYGNADGTAESALYVPAGFTTHSAEPGPTDAAVTFYYPRLGNLTEVTLAVFHVAHFAISSEQNGRVRIGAIGGPGGSFAAYKHSHIEFYRGNTGLPSASARERLRIDPASVFAPSPVARMRSVTARRSD